MTTRVAASRLALAPLALLVLLVEVSSLHAESTLQVTPDERATLIDKTVGDERWLISYDHPTGSARGHVIFAGDRSPRFLDCGQVAADVSTVTLSCWGAAPCVAAPCLADEWHFIQEVALPRSFFAPVAQDPVVAACPDLSGSWSVRFALGGRRFIGGLLATIVQEGCAFVIDIAGMASGIGIAFADAATVDLTYSVAGTSERCTVQGYGPADALAFGLAFSRRCPFQAMALGGRRRAE